MRIQRIRLQNLNSLVGEWTIDFTDPAYTEDGIFAISGPTGAGKTTVLDAICLALYGRTPRLERVNKNSNEIMSRHTGSCYAEISFVTQEGEFICHWSQQRARKKPDGELQPPKHEIANAASGEVLENKIRDVAVRVEQITGMNFKQFTRSMLLAQGGFAAFLQASPDERAPILEQITGTEIYSEISMRVHQRTREEKNYYEALRSEIEGMQVLSAEEENKLQAELEAKSAQALQQQNQLATVREALGWLNKTHDLNQEIRLLQDQWQQYEERREAFREDGKRLEKAQRAMALEGGNVELQNLRKLQADDLEKMEIINNELPGQIEALQTARQALMDASQKLQELKQRRKREGETAKQVRAMDLLLKQQNGKIEELQKLVAVGEKAKAKLHQQIADVKRELDRIDADLAAIGQYRAAHRQYAALVTDYAGISRTLSDLGKMESDLQERRLYRQKAAQTLNNLTAARQEIAAINQENCHNAAKKELLVKEVQSELQGALQGYEVNWWWKELERCREQGHKLQKLEQSMLRLKQLETDLSQHQQAEGKFIEQQVDLEAQIHRLEIENDHRAKEAAHLETQVTLLNRIHDLESERFRLEDGEPCPLCGAVEHPYAVGNVPVMDGAEEGLRLAREAWQQSNRDLNELNLRKAATDKELLHCTQLVRQVENNMAAEAQAQDAIYGEADGKLRNLTTIGQVQAGLDQVEFRINQYTQRLGLIDDLQQSEKEQRAIYEEYRTAVIQSEKDLQGAVLLQAQAEQENQRLAEELSELQTSIDQLRRNALQEVGPYGIDDLSADKLEDIKRALEKWKNLWVENEAEQLRLEQKAQILQTEAGHLQTLLQSSQITWDNAQTDLVKERQEHTRQQAARRDLYGELDPDTEEAGLEMAVNKGEELVDIERQTVARLQLLLERTQERESLLVTSTKLRAPRLQSMEEEFNQQIRQAGFQGEADYLLARLSAEDRFGLKRQAESLLKEETELLTRLADKQETLQIEQAKQVTDQEQPVLAEKLLQLEQAMKSIQEEIGADKKMLADNQAARRQMEARREQYTHQQKVFNKWQALHNLIGSVDGKKFRNYAQGLTFAVMISNANRQLQKMSDRYLLIRNPDQPLELNVIDHYQAGEMRSTINLSGGESFLVSLALALGLSQMSSSKVSVDSLFLDEGFGALDGDVLDSALNTLAGLQQEGKLIGVISHVQALQERIGTHIQVIPQSGGRSILKGPGCYRSK